jgi:hypothetical protein
MTHWLMVTLGVLFLIVLPTFAVIMAFVAINSMDP